MQWTSSLQWLILLSSAFLFILADFLSANWGKTGSVASLGIMCILAPFSYFLFGVLNKHMSLSVSSALVNMLIVLGGVLVGVLYFKDALSMKQYAGIATALLSIYLLNAK